MIKALVAGVIALGICLVIGWYEHSLHWLMDATGIATAILIGLAILLSGAFVSGDRMRANDVTETSDDRRTRFNRVENLIIASLPCLMVTAIIYFAFQ